MADFAGNLAMSPTILVDFTHNMTAPRRRDLFGTGAYLGSMFTGGESVGGAGTSAGEYQSLLALLTPGIKADNFASGGLTNTSGGANQAGRLAPESVHSFEWFERVHLIPRVKIDFGNIISTVTRSFELFNAYRKTDVSLTSIVNNALPGLEFLTITPAIVVPALTSILDPSSTFNSAAGTSTPGAGLVKTVATAFAQGLPQFDTSVLFNFSPGGTLTMLVKGNRIALLTPEPEAPVTERLGFLTDVIEAIDGSEKRASLRKRPRCYYDLLFSLDLDDRQRMQAMLFGWQSSTFALPLWHERLALTANASAAATTCSVGPTTADVDFRVGGLAVIYETATKYDVVQVTAVATNSISFSGSPLTNSYTIGNSLIWVIPVRTAELVQGPSGSRPPVNLEDFRLSFRVTDNDTGAPAASTAGWSVHTDGKILLDDFNIVEGENPSTFVQRVLIIDNATGKVETSSRWAQNRRGHQKGFVARTKAEVLKLRKLLMALDGRRVSLWIPTFINDLTVVATLNSGSVTMDITHVGYTRFVQSREPKKTFKITFTDGTSLVRTVSSSIEVSSSVERLTLNTSWPATRTTAEVSSVQFYEKVRFDTDEFSIEHRRVGLAMMFAPVKVVLE